MDGVQRPQNYIPGRAWGAEKWGCSKALTRAMLVSVLYPCPHQSMYPVPHHSSSAPATVQACEKQLGPTYVDEQVPLRGQQPRTLGVHLLQRHGVQVQSQGCLGVISCALKREAEGQPGAPDSSSSAGVSGYAGISRQAPRRKIGLFGAELWGKQSNSGGPGSNRLGDGTLNPCTPLSPSLWGHS